MSTYNVIVKLNLRHIGGEDPDPTVEEDWLDTLEDAISEQLDNSELEMSAVDVSEEEGGARFVLEIEDVDVAESLI